MGTKTTIGRFSADGYFFLQAVAAFCLLLLWPTSPQAITCVAAVDAPWYRPTHLMEAARQPFLQLQDGSILQWNRNEGLFQIEADWKSRTPIKLPEKRKPYFVEIGAAGRDALILALRESVDGKAAPAVLYRYDGVARKLTALGTMPAFLPATGEDIYALSDGSALIVNSYESSIWRYDPVAQSLGLVSKDKSSSVVPLSNGRAILSGTRDGSLHVYDPKLAAFDRVSLGDKISGPASVLALPDGGALIATSANSTQRLVRYFHYRVSQQRSNSSPLTELKVQVPPSARVTLNGQEVAPRPEWLAVLPNNRALLSLSQRVGFDGKRDAVTFIVDYNAGHVKHAGSQFSGYDVIDVPGYSQLILVRQDERVIGAEPNDTQLVDAKLLDKATLHEEMLFLRLNRQDLRDSIFLPAHDGALLILGKYVYPLPPPGTTMHSAELLNPPALGSSQLTKWKLTGPCATDLRADMLTVSARRTDANLHRAAWGQRASQIYDLEEPSPKTGNVVTFSQNVDFPGPDEWQLKVTVGGRGHRPEDIGKPETASLRKSLVAQLAENADLIGYSALALYFSAFILLLFASRWSANAFRIVCDPFWSKASVLSWVLLSYLPVAQRWILHPWFSRIRAQRPALQPYLQMPLRDPLGGRTVDSKEVLSILRDERHLCIQGNSGMGKTALADFLTDTYFERDRKTLAHAYQKHGFVLLPIRARKHKVEGDSKPHSQWVLDSVSAQFEEQGLSLTDPTLVRAMLSSGQFVLLIDGINEVPGLSNAVSDFTTRFGHAARIVVMAQSEMPKPFYVLRLPPSIGDHAKDLLELKIGSQGNVLYRRLSEACLLGHLSSGYEVQLVVDLVGKDPQRADLPGSRAGLYQAVLGSIDLADGTEPPLDLLRFIAWEMICDQTRRTPVENLRRVGQATYEALTTSRIPVVQVHGEAVEFRHDLMRAYLAAEWLVLNSPSSDALIVRMSESSVWNSPRRDQEALWAFVAEITSPGWIEHLWRFAIDEPSRGYLQRALQERADSEGLNLHRDSTG